MITKQDLKPTQTSKATVYDTLANLGFDMSDWSQGKHGEIKNPKNNSSKNKAWGFFQSGHMALLMLWWSTLKESNDGEIFSVYFARDGALDPKAHPKSRANALAMDHALRSAYKENIKTRVMIRLATDALHTGVKYEKLDEADWWVESYNDETGEARIVRLTESNREKVIAKSKDGIQNYLPKDDKSIRLVKSDTNPLNLHCSSASEHEQNQDESTEDETILRANYSKRAKEIGDAAERKFFNYLRENEKSEHLRSAIVWDAGRGRKPGYDISDRRIHDRWRVYEVKATTADKFNCFLLTANEYATAKKMGDQYVLVLITNCESENPTFFEYPNPAKLIEEQKLSVKPTCFSISRAI